MWWEWVGMGARRDNCGRDLRLKILFYLPSSLGNILGVMVWILRLLWLRLASHWAPLCYTIVFGITFCARG
jgi:hypothetical protein